MLLEAFATAWVRKQVKLQEAEMMFAAGDVEDKVRTYRNNLLTQMLDDHYAGINIDTVILAPQIQEHYRLHRETFRLDRPLVKGRIVRVPNTFRQHAQLRELMASESPQRQQSFLEMCAKNNLELTVVERWTPFRDFLAGVPTLAGRNYDYMIPVRKVQELADADNKYYIQITESAAKDQQAPVEWVEPLIRTTILSQRRGAVIRAQEDSLYSAARLSERISINVNTQ
jgi:hypothetical protein